MRNKRIFMFIICYNHVVSKAISYLKTKVIMKFILWPQQSFLDLKILVSTLPNWTIIND